MEVIDSVIFSRLIVNFEAVLEKISKQLEHLKFSVKWWHLSGERFWQFGKFVDIVKDICRVVVLYQPLKDQQFLICFNLRRVISLRKCGWLVERFSLLSWTYIGGAVSDFLVNSCYHLVAFFWAWVLRRLVVEDACVTMRSLWEWSSFFPWLELNEFPDASGAVPVWTWTSGFMRQSPGRDSAPKMQFCILLNSWDNFFLTLPSISSETWVMYSFCDLGTFEFCAKLLLGCSLFSAASFLLFLKVAALYGKRNDQRLILDYLFAEGNAIWVFINFQKYNIGNQQYWYSHHYLWHFVRLYSLEMRRK